MSMTAVEMMTEAAQKMHYGGGGLVLW